MPKKNKTKKNTKNSNSNVEKRLIIEADINGQVYGIIEKALGNRFFNVNCFDNVKRRCKIRKKRTKVDEGDCVIVSLRNFDDNNADIIHKYNSDEITYLQSVGLLPMFDITTNSSKDDNENNVFNFEEI